MPNAGINAGRMHAQQDMVISHYRLVDLSEL
jgi:hypothetical protein